jgi:hypothetical protein
MSIDPSFYDFLVLSKPQAGKGLSHFRTYLGISFTQQKALKLPQITHISPGSLT